MIQFDEHIFQKGGFNHQLGKVDPHPQKKTPSETQKDHGKFRDPIIPQKVKLGFFLGWVQP